MTPVIVAIIIVATIIRLAVILRMLLSITKIFLIMIPIISTMSIIVTMAITRIRITIIRNTIVFFQINIERNNTNSKVKHQSKKPKDNFLSNNDSDNNNFNNSGNKKNNPLDNECHIEHVNNTRNTVFILGNSIA